MSTKEPRRNKEKSSSSNAKTQSKSDPSDATNIDDWLDSFDAGSSVDTVNSSSITNNSKSRSIDIDTEQVEVGQEGSLDDLIAEFVRQLPGWINKPWMYVKPTHEGHLQSWYQSWRDLLLKYTKMLSKHIITIYDLKETHPFSNESSGKSLSIEQVQYIINSMIDENLAKWLDNDQARARIYFTTDAEWADIIYDYMVDTGYVLDIMTLYELHNLDQDWSSLPDEELCIVLDILVDEQKAEWIGNDRDTIQFKLQ